MLGGVVICRMLLGIGHAGSSGSSVGNSCLCLMSRLGCCRSVAESDSVAPGLSLNLLS